MLLDGQRCALVSVHIPSLAAAFVGRMRSCARLVRLTAPLTCAGIRCSRARPHLRSLRSGCRASRRAGASAAGERAQHARASWRRQRVAGAGARAAGTGAAGA